MPITLELSASAEARVRALAGRAGMSAEKYATDIVEAQVPAERQPVASATGTISDAEFDDMIERAIATGPDLRRPIPGRTFDEILEPVRLAFAESGETEEEVLSLIKEERRKLRIEHNSRSGNRG